jgi:hypothetical protein
MKLTFFHYIFHDKDNYHKDDNLKGRWEKYKYILGYLRKESFPLLKDKFIYFMKYKKLTTLKRFTIIAVIGIMIYFSSYYGGKSVVNYVNSKFKLHMFEKSVKYIPKIDEYVPDTISLERRIKDLSLSLSLSPEQINKKFTFITVYSVDSTKTLKKFLERLGEIESRNQYDCRRQGSQYLGRWQMGDQARRIIGFGNISYEKFLHTPEIQDAAVVLLLKYNYNYMRPYLKRYNNRIIRGYHLTTSGMLAMAHNVGADAVIGFLNSACSNVPHDGNGSSDRFLILGNYELSSLEK